LVSPEMFEMTQRLSFWMCKCFDWNSFSTATNSFSSSQISPTSEILQTMLPKHLNSGVKTYRKNTHWRSDR